MDDCRLSVRRNRNDDVEAIVDYLGTCLLIVNGYPSDKLRAEIERALSTAIEEFDCNSNRGRN